MLRRFHKTSPGPLRKSHLKTLRNFTAMRRGRGHHHSGGPETVILRTIIECTYRHPNMAGNGGRRGWHRDA
ncbi:hypothetical protein KL86PLE_10265 [uncultured Pleomorphomonas sp.]|uniref:Uncharacterized protein n=1 Tax=uncultured Pleomorphomonas sp. TaxID=442121 RepID=A0A212KZK0_9HYPH|nr:hypothetical protein KL86PLE_10265 [uncultured Pleomorphomonas sp.]